MIYIWFLNLARHIPNKNRYLYRHKYNHLLRHRYHLEIKQLAGDEIAAVSIITRVIENSTRFTEESRIVRDLRAYVEAIRARRNAQTPISRQCIDRGLHGRPVIGLEITFGICDGIHCICRLEPPLNVVPLIVWPLTEDTSTRNGKPTATDEVPPAPTNEVLPPIP